MVLARSRRVRAGARDQPERDDENPRSPGEGSALGRYRPASEVVKPRRFRADGDGQGPGRGRRRGGETGSRAAGRPAAASCPVSASACAWGAARLACAQAPPGWGGAAVCPCRPGGCRARNERNQVRSAVRRACTDEFMSDGTRLDCCHFFFQSSRCASRVLACAVEVDDRRGLLFTARASRCCDVAERST